MEVEDKAAALVAIKAMPAMDANQVGKVVGKALHGRHDHLRLTLTRPSLTGQEVVVLVHHPP